MKLKGIVVKGLSSASGKKQNWNGFGSIYHQVNNIRKINPKIGQELLKCKMATINVEFKNIFLPTKWEYIFNKIYWLPTSDTWSEKLSFTKITVIYQQTNFIGWLYKADKSPHKNNLFQAEIISENIKNLKYNDEVILQIDNKYFI